ncbi:S41 family peptidase [Culicoidibacter larvae]|uniref:PDZ domain-containing protein n=1 Tax=Culicoidibacter larvae TaxID=2579976 RepID=A0A5R8QGI3_9FIRM|nr:S41 family peptidase [Culicoidibacter larvae]TLG77115.1 PDZ domain-containing protein [Culicoidibacter larvae]
MNKKRFNAYTLVLVALVAILVSVLGTTTIMSAFNTVQYDSMAKFEQALALIRQNALAVPDQDKLIDGAIKGLTESLDDPHSTYFTKSEADEFRQSLSSSFDGIGVRLLIVAGEPVITEVFPGSPAETAGMKVNDVIVSVDGNKVSGDNSQEVVDQLTGKKGTTVKVDVRRGDASETLSITRDAITVEAAETKVITSGDKKIGYIVLDSFTEDAGTQYLAALESLQNEGVSGVIVDLRNNGGGYVSSVSTILDKTVSDTKPYVQTVDKDGRTVTKFSSISESPIKDVVVVVNENTASASEIMTAAYREIEGFKVVGTKTYGKGTAQNTFDLIDGSQLKLTIEKWLTPDGNWINEKGITPDVVQQATQPYLIPYISTDKVYQLGDTGYPVSYMQHLLKFYGYQIGYDAQFDEETEAGIKKFQADNGLEQTGKMDFDTVQTMNEKNRAYRENQNNDTQLQKAIEQFN